jgi:hypothetical protein
MEQLMLIELHPIDPKSNEAGFQTESACVDIELNPVKIAMIVMVIFFILIFLSFKI